MEENRPEIPNAAFAACEAKSSNSGRGDRFARWVRNLSLASLGFSGLAALVLWSISERTWWGTVFTFCPRHAFLVPPAVLLLWSVHSHRKSIVINLLSLTLVSGPLMGGQVRFTWLKSGEVIGHELSVVSCNVQEYRPDFEDLLRKIVERHPDLVALQEAPREHELFARYFQGWSTIQEPNLWIGSHFPLSKLDESTPPLHPRGRVLSVRVDMPNGPFILHNVHLMTPRHGLSKLSIDSVLNGKGPAFVEESTRRRLLEAREVRRYVAKNQRILPTLVVGDFNMPTVSNLYRDVWQDFTNAFDAAGTGFGYSAPCSTHNFWFDDTPWVRIDHILADGAWTIHRCEIGNNRGSDHRLIWALLARRRLEPLTR